jgi:hypothetical protein
MKKIFVTISFICIASFAFSQNRAFGVSFSSGKGFLENSESHVLPVRPTVSDIELTYMRYETEKISWHTGLGVTFQTFYSQYQDLSAPQYLDQAIHLEIPYHFNYHPTKWFYVGAGLNSKFRISTATFPLYNDYQIGPEIQDINIGGRNLLLEGVINTGLQYDINNTIFRLGGVYEKPFNNNEYSNLGFEASVLFKM